MTVPLHNPPGRLTQLTLALLAALRDEKMTPESSAVSVPSPVFTEVTHHSCPPLRLLAFTWVRWRCFIAFVKTLIREENFWSSTKFIVSVVAVVAVVPALKYWHCGGRSGSTELAVQECLYLDSTHTRKLKISDPPVGRRTRRPLLLPPAAPRAAPRLAAPPGPLAEYKQGRKRLVVQGKRLTLIPISKVISSQRQVHELEGEDAVTQQASALVDSDLLPRGRTHVFCPGHGIADNG
ncbi:hypothetical protein O3P69_014484 [Scylla paramamosain]|uniref:Uncharacterized protein n=1 Tax=Scylla paramamosain TaxID=85552 RepID=A0AAW0TBK5_SCYPA